MTYGGHGVGRPGLKTTARPLTSQAVPTALLLQLQQRRWRRTGAGGARFCTCGSCHMKQVPLATDTC